MTGLRARAERGLRSYARHKSRPSLACSTARREGDEMACRCGRRWPIGEDHPS